MSLLCVFRSLFFAVVTFFLIFFFNHLFALFFDFFLSVLSSFIRQYQVRLALAPSFFVTFVTLVISLHPFLRRAYGPFLSV